MEVSNSAGVDSTFKVRLHPTKELKSPTDLMFPANRVAYIRSVFLSREDLEGTMEDKHSVAFSTHKSLFGLNSSHKEFKPSVGARVGGVLPVERRLALLKNRPAF
ncbi:hypothetical protein PHYSODRAFT_325838 [Phytophthora sojae]|uniref:Uncharacterized protein n=1 Tax=Phytophthora sojae (strain P6497) TaxID=1094619 RepID=G4YS56_PHYSP|nr:hypothetical protein PHYSODRAFT_325838 [Phytophthora sojae]EGZ24757.1 hypothetical protein PHYSODRAFT_325838 [Phytophthora sojae]|eukprot:XP_009520045.1 hypothetical protein PHYSODRAFT_325838 [Phytophthora sojae]